MFGGTLHLCCEADLSSSRVRSLDSWGWRKRENWKSTRIRVKVDHVRGGVQECAQGKRIAFISRNFASPNGGAILGQSKLRVGSGFASSSLAGADELEHENVAEAESSALCTVPVTDFEGVTTQLPLQVSTGLVLESLGTLYSGPHQEKYWSRMRCGHQHPYPVGYTATKTYKGVQYKQSIEEGPNGPRYVVGELNKASFTADHPSKAWSLAVVDSGRIHGGKHFGFESSLIVGLMLRMSQDHVGKTEVEKTEEKSNGQSRSLEKYDTDCKEYSLVHGSPADGSLEDNVVPKFVKAELQSEKVPQSSVPEQSTERKEDSLVHGSPADESLEDNLVLKVVGAELQSEKVPQSSVSEQSTERKEEFSVHGSPADESLEDNVVSKFVKAELQSEKVPQSSVSEQSTEHKEDSSVHGSPGDGGLEDNLVSKFVRAELQSEKVPQSSVPEQSTERKDESLVHGSPADRSLEDNVVSKFVKAELQSEKVPQSSVPEQSTERKDESLVHGSPADRSLEDNLVSKFVKAELQSEKVPQSSVPELSTECREESTVHGSRTDGSLEGDLVSKVVKAELQSEKVPHSSVPEQSTEHKEDLSVHGSPLDRRLEDKDSLMARYVKAEQSEKVPHLAIPEQPRPLTWTRCPSLGEFGHIIRLRSALVEDTVHQKVQILSGQDTIGGGYRGYFQEAVAKLDKLEDLMSIGTPSSEKHQISGPRPMSDQNHSSFIVGGLKQGVSNPDATQDSVLRRINPVIGSNGYGSVLDNRKRGSGLQQKRSGTRLFSPLHRSQVLLDEAVSKNAGKDNRQPGHSKSLTTLLDSWNRRDKSHIAMNDKPHVSGDGKMLPFVWSSSKGERVAISEEKKDASVADVSRQIRLLELSDEDLKKRVKEWRSGEEGRSSVLKEIRLHIVNNHGEEALRIFQMLQSNGVHLNDSVYSVFFPFTLDDWQKRVVELVKTRSVLLCAPGGAGKFVVAVRSLYQAFIQGEQCLFVTPFEALAKEHMQKFQKLFGSKNVGGFEKNAVDGKLRFPITVITLETVIKELREGRFSKGPKGDDFLVGLSLAVMDRFHTIGDAHYGSMWEEVVMLLNKKVKLLTLALPMRASRDIAYWITRIHRRCELVTCDSEPVPKLYYNCDTSGLHLLGNRDQKGLMEPSWRRNVDDLSTTESHAIADLQLCTRVLLHSVLTEKFLPLAISFSSIDECMASMRVASEMIQGDHVSPAEVACIEQRLQEFLNGNIEIQQSVTKDDLNCLSRGFCMFHEGQLQVWLEFVQGLIEDNLVKIVLGTYTMLCRTRISVYTMAVFSTSRSESGKLSHSGWELTQLLGKAGRRGLETNGNVVFLGTNPMWRNGAVLTSETPVTVSSQFKPSYSLVLNLLNKHTLPEVRRLVELNFGEHLERKMLKEEEADLRTQITSTKEWRADQEAKLIQKLNKINFAKLQDATSFTQVDIRVSKDTQSWIDSASPGILFAVVPGPTELLYLILCADNSFRLLPVCAVDHVHSKHQLDVVYKRATGVTLQPPPLPSQARWKIFPGDYVSYISVGNKESARIVDVLLQHGVKTCESEEESNHREEIKSSTKLLETLQLQASMLASRRTSASTAWTRAEKLIEALKDAGAVESISSDGSETKLTPLGELMSRLHHVENELWCAVALTSSIVRPLTASELGAVCSALVFADQENDLEYSGSKPGGLKMSTITPDAPKRLQAALEKLGNLRKQVDTIQGSDDPPIRLDGKFVATVHSLGRDAIYQNSATGLPDKIVHLVHQTVKLLLLVDEVWLRSTDLLSALGATSSLHSVARRAAHLLQKVNIHGGDLLHD